MRASIFSRGRPTGDIISAQKAPVGRILRNFRLHMHTRKGTPKVSRDLRSLPVALLVMSNDTFCTTTLVRKKHAKKSGKRRTYFRSLPVWVSAGHVTSGSSTTSLYHKCCLNCAHILLTLG